MGGFEGRTDYAGLRQAREHFDMAAQAKTRHEQDALLAEGRRLMLKSFGKIAGDRTGENGRPQVCALGSIRAHGQSD